MLTILFVPSGTVCLECVIGGALATEASFQIENMEVAPSEGTVVNGTLVVFDSETTFSGENTIVRCMSGSTSHQAFVEHESKSQHYPYWMNHVRVYCMQVSDLQWSVE